MPLRILARACRLEWFFEGWGVLQSGFGASTPAAEMTERARSRQSGTDERTDVQRSDGWIEQLYKGTDRLVDIREGLGERRFTTGFG